MIGLVFLLVVPPPVLPEDLFRFPDRDEVHAALDFSSTVIFNLKRQQSLQIHRYWEYEARIQAIQDCRCAWIALNYAHLSCSDDRDGLMACLEDLRRIIGSDAYYAGRMPPPVPPSAFVEID